MSRAHHLVRETELGRIEVADGAIRQVVAAALAESYGVVGTPGRRFPRLRRGKGSDGVEVRTRGDGLELVLTVVVEYGLKLSEVAATVQDRVRYDVERTTGLTVAAVEVRIEDARRS
jgi:uncharacterized alkaline shock family protein YloU